VFLSTASSKVMINGAPGRRICHGRVLRQEDPLSPMLFLLVMEVLNAIIRKAESWSLFQQLGVKSILHCTSLYEDDLVIFINPSTSDLELTHGIFELFEGASGLSCNVGKCQMVPIRCDEEQVALATGLFPCQVAEFPLKCLGIPLSIYKLLKTVLRPLVDRIAHKLLTWKGSLMHHSGRLSLIESTLSAMLVYTSIGIGFPLG
jgi:hypothetical protein